MNTAARLRKVEQTLSNKHEEKKVEFFIKENGKYYIEKDGQRIEAAKPKANGPGISVIVFEVPKLN